MKSKKKCVTLVKTTVLMSSKPQAYLNYVNYLLAPIEISNTDLCKQFPKYTEQKIFDSSGVSRRYKIVPDTLSSDFGAACGEAFFKKFPIKKEEIDFLIFCTEGPDYLTPSTSCIVQHKLGLNTSIGTYDLTFGCSGYTYGLSLAKALVESGMAQNVLFICADIPTCVLPHNAPALHFLFSDAASANLISNNPIGSKINNFSFGTDGSGERVMMLKNSSFNEPKDKEWFQDPQNKGLKLGRMEMAGEAVFNFVLKSVPLLIKDILQKNQIKFEEVDLFIFHQASGIILKSLKRKLNIPDEKFISNLSEVGNTMSASIPVAFYEAEREGRIKPGMRILIAGFGVGYSWSGTILHY